MAEASTPALVPMTITPEPADEPAPSEPAHLDTIEIKIGGGCRVRVGSSIEGRHGVDAPLGNPDLLH